MNSLIYHSRITHQRLSPLRHRLDYRVFNLLLDIDELPDLPLPLRDFSYNQKNRVSFFDCDHGARDGTPLRPWVTKALAPLALMPPDKIMLLCMPRLYNTIFNPLSVYFCYHGEALAAVIYEVKNTFGDQHCYAVKIDRAATQHRHTTAKNFYVSPLLPMQGQYDFALRPPAASFALTINTTMPDGKMLVANWAGEGEALNNQSLRMAIQRHRFLPLLVLGGIHLHALFTWLRGATFYHRSPVPEGITYLS
jgi:hypothetical protein